MANYDLYFPRLRFYNLRLSSFLPDEIRPLDNALATLSRQ